MLNLSKEDKIKLVTGKGAWHTDDCNGQFPSVLMADGPHELRIPLADGVNQNNSSLVSTCYPTASALALSWDLDAVTLMADAYAKEAIHTDVDIVLGLGVNIKRSPLCGRNFEYYSKDPYLSGMFATTFINTMQSHGVGVSLKHFAGNNQETHRQTQNSQIDERALREIYLAAFEMAVKKSSPLTIMASHNRLNGAYACANKRLLTDILRDEWGYDGTVISDWGASIHLPYCIHAGMDLEMPDNHGIHEHFLISALKEEKQVSPEDLDRAAFHVTKLIEYKMTQNAISKGKRLDYYSQGPHELAIELAAKSAVLLKNDGMLPLSTNQEILVIGDLALNMRFQGGGSSHITTIAVQNAIDSLKTVGYKVLFESTIETFNDLFKRAEFSGNRIIVCKTYNLSDIKI